MDFAFSKCAKGQCSIVLSLLASSKNCGPWQLHLCLCPFVVCFSGVDADSTRIEDEGTAWWPAFDKLQVAFREAAKQVCGRSGLVICATRARRRF